MNPSSRMVDSLASIVVADWNGEKYMPRCLDAVGVQTFCDYEIIVIENASSDRSVDGLETLWPGLQLLRPEGNLGFAVANNLGACRARSPEPPGRKHTS